MLMGNLFLVISRLWESFPVHVDACDPLSNLTTAVWSLSKVNPAENTYPAGDPVVNCHPCAVATETIVGAKHRLSPPPGVEIPHRTVTA